jgi:uncharacterized membrane protein
MAPQAVLESIFAFFFKYRPSIFSQGELAFGAAWPLSGVIIGAVLLAAAALVTYRGVKPHSARDRVLLIALRLGALAVIAFCLFRPVLVLRAAVPQQNFIAVLMDDSRSMQIADGGQPRAEFVRQQFGQGSKVLQALSDKFVLRFFRFSSSTDRIQGAADLTFTGTQSRVSDALRRAHDELSGLPLAGLVMVTDGADTTDESVAPALLALKADAVPVFTVGVGRESVSKDIQVNQVQTPRTVLKGASLMVDVALSQSGYGGSEVPLQVEDEGRIVAQEQVRFPLNGEPAAVRVHFTASQAGPRLFRFRVPPQNGEQIAQNNAREALIQVVDRREKILYFEGEPRFEVKFIRRAVADDKNLQIVVLQRTAENKYLRLDVDQSEELITGFPKTREELFAYRGIILGSIEAAAFTPDQLRMIGEFVNKRGGGLLALGGRRAFAEGGYAGTPVAEVLPVILEQNTAQKGDEYFSEVSVQPTREGAIHPTTQIAGTEQQSIARWNDLPPVTSVNPIRRIKPGATVLLSGQDKTRQNQVVLAFQRYGRGKSLVFSIQDSWIWQMHASIPLEDMTHENLWRRLSRWLVEGVPSQVEVRTSRDRVDPGDTVTILADVADATWVDVNNGHVVAHITSPTGKSSELAMDWTTERDGEYRTIFTPQEQGLYDIKVEASREGKSIGTSSSYVRVAPGDAEYFDSAMRVPLLRRIADETGGRFYTADNVAGLAEDINYTGRGVTVVEERDLWDMPALLILLVGVVFAEWSFRRARGLA